MMYNERRLELAIMEYFKGEGYTHVTASSLSRMKKDVIILDDLTEYLQNRYPILTQNEITMIFRKLKNLSGTLYEINKKAMDMLSNGFIFQREDKNEKDIYIELLDFDNIDNNLFKIVNQFEIEEYHLRIPDAVVFINGLPVVVLEFKSAVNENTTVKDAYTQLTVRYQRDIPSLFHFNGFVVISDGVNNRYGSLFAPYDFFYGWRRVEFDSKEVDGISSLTSMINGLFRKDRLLSVLRDYIYFADRGERKIVVRYPQFFASELLLKNIKEHCKPLGDGKGGVYFGATGCGKSFTMVFLSRLLMKDRILKNPTIVLITDRTDLDNQLSSLFLASKQYIREESILNIESREELKSLLGGRESGGVYLTTIHKFTEDIALLSDRANIICISDEAHRSQLNLDGQVVISETGVERKYGFAKYLHDSLPNATYVGFTGTPIDATIDVFGDIVDSYTMTESVQDGITVNLVYEGRAAKVNLDHAKINSIEKYYAECEKLGANEHQIEESKKAVTNLHIILGNPSRLRKVAEDFVNHYETRVAEKATTGKAMFVCASREIAFTFYKLLLETRPEWGETLPCDPNANLSEFELKKIKPMEKLKMVMTRGKDDEKKLFDLLGTSEYRKELDRQYKMKHSNFKIVIVVDMWSTGFDVPSLDTIYIDKPLNNHTLIQTISRVNRVYAGKDKGLVVDYIGIKNNMDSALAKYTNFNKEEFEGIEDSAIIVKDQLEVLGQMFYKFDSTTFFQGESKEQLECLNLAVEWIQRTEDLEIRFMKAVKMLRKAFSLCSASDLLSRNEKEYIHFYSAVRSILFKLTKGEAPDISTMNDVVRKLVEDAIISNGVEELFSIGSSMNKITVDIFSEEYMNRIALIQLPNTKIRVLESLLKQSVDSYKKTNKMKALEFEEKLQRVIDNYNDRRKEEAYATEVLEEVAEQLTDLLHDLKEEQVSHKEKGIDFEEKAFFDILSAVAKKYEFEFQEDELIALAKDIKKVVDDKAKYTDWANRDDIKAEFQVDLIMLLDEHGYPPVTMDDVFREVLEQAENFKKNL